MKKTVKIVAIMAIIATLLSLFSISAFAQTKTLSYSTSGGEIIAKAEVTFKNSGLKQTNSIKITNNSDKQVYVLIDGCGRYIGAKSSYTLTYAAYLGVTTTTNIKIQSVYRQLSMRDVVITTSQKGSIYFSQTIRGSKVK